jgi:hypothetical protein
MEGSKIKELLVHCDKNLNEFQYYDNTKIYDIDEVNNVLVPKDKLRNMLRKKFGKSEGNYIIKMIYNKNDNYVDPKKILGLFNK